MIDGNRRAQRLDACAKRTVTDAGIDRSMLLPAGESTSQQSVSVPPWRECSGSTTLVVGDSGRVKKTVKNR